MSRLTRYADFHRWLLRLVVLGALLGASLSWQHHSAPRAAAGGWSKASFTYCDTSSSNGWRPWGKSVLAWNDIVAASGESYSTIWHYNGSNWVIKGQGQNSGSGSTGSAVAEANAPYVTGELYTSGSHASNFFGGWVDSYSPSAWC